MTSLDRELIGPHAVPCGSVDISELVIGSGRYSKIYLGQMIKDNAPVTVAIKCCHDETHDIINTIEYEILQKSHHPNIVQLEGVVSTPAGKCLCLEWAPDGDLFQAIVSSDGLPEDVVRPLIKQIAQGLDYLHNLGYVHCDVKPENILMFGTDDGMIYKLTDFGLSIKWTTGKMVMVNNGTLTYASPEALFRQPNPGPNMDVWSLGVVLYVALTAYSPFYGADNNIHAYHTYWAQNGVKMPLPKGVSAQSLLDGMVQLDYRHRMTLKKVIHHPWVNNQMPTPRRCCHVI